MKKIPVALVYDFDGTLAPGNMQEHRFIPSLGMDDGAFWNEVEEVTQSNDVDGVLAYMYWMISVLNSRKVCLTRQMLRDSVKGLQFFPGVLEWFDIINGWTEQVEIHHYVVSSGLREMIRGTPIAKHMKHIFASDFIYDKHGNVLAPGLGVNYTNKTQFLFRINKNTPKIFDIHTINNSMPDEEKPIPFSNMIYIGDGETDIPCLKVVRREGGYGIAVYDPAKEKARKVVEQLMDEKRIFHAAPADFTDEGKLITIVRQMIDAIVAKQKLYYLRGL